MSPQPLALPHVVPSRDVLDDLELLRAGVDLSQLSETPLRVPNPGRDPVIEIREPEGVPLAHVAVDTDQEGTAAVRKVERWLAPRPERPFESLHRTVAETRAPTCLVVINGRADAHQVSRSLIGHDDRNVLVLVPASVESDGATDAREVGRVREVVGAIEESATTDRPGYMQETVVVPVGPDHPGRRERITLSANAFARGAPVVQVSAPELESGHSKPLSAGAVIFFTGLSGSGKSTLAKAVRNRLLERSAQAVTLLDGDVVRRELSAGLGFGAADRDTNIRRIGWVAARIAEHGGLAICSPIAPFAATRNAVQKMVEQAGGRFVLVHVATPLAECERRDRKGLYARARVGDIPDFTGISSPYEVPAEPDMRIDTTGKSIEPVVEHILASGERLGLWNGMVGLGHG